MMSISSRQFKQLTEMGIILWHPRQTKNTLTTISCQKSQASSHKTYDKVDLANLTRSQCFNDILLAMNLSIGEIKTEEYHLNLGLFNWAFPINNTEEITFTDNQLSSPQIKLIANSSALKRQLWHLLNTQIL